MASSHLKLIIFMWIAVILHNTLCLNHNANEKNPCKSDRTIIRVFDEFDDSHLNSIQLFDSEHEKVKNTTYVAYGKSVFFFCFGDVDADRLSITWDGKKIWHRRYDNSIGVHHKKLVEQLGAYEYGCINAENGCQHSVTAVVTPGIEVVSENIQIDFAYTNPVVNYTVQYGDAMSVICSGPDADKLIISKDGKTILTKQISDTSVKHFVEKPELQISRYICKANHKGTDYNTSVIIRVIPRIHFQSKDKTIIPFFSKLFHKYIDSKRLQNYYVEYEDYMQIYCSGPQSVKVFGAGNKSINVEKVNETTVRLIKDIKLGSFDLSCSDSEISDYVNSISVVITPKIEIKSPNIRYVGKWIDGFTNKYTIKHGDPLETICHGPNGTRLILKISPSNKKVVNVTSLTYISEESDIDIGMRHICSTKDCGEDHFGYPSRCKSNSLNQAVINVLPGNVTDFSCISYDEKRLNCSWTWLENIKDMKFTLSEVNINNEFTRICKLDPSSRNSKFCVWEYEFLYDHNQKNVFNLQLQTCNLWVCSNQSFVIEHASVMKISAPENLTLISKTPRSAVLRWSAPHLYRAGQHFYSNVDCDYKVEYHFSTDLNPRKGNSIECDKEHCTVEVSLPCPGQFYVVQVYRKLKIAGDKFWSDPSTNTFPSDLDDGEVLSDECSWQPKLTAEVMTYFLQQLKLEFHLEMLQLRKDIRELKDKVDVISNHVTYQEKEKEMNKDKDGN